MNVAFLGTDFQLPILFFQGTEGADTPTWLAREYVDKIHVSRKEYVPMKGGHFVVWNSPGQFLKELVTRVRPLAMQT